MGIFFLFDFPRRWDQSTETSSLLRPFLYRVTHAEKSLRAAYHLAIKLRSISSHATNPDADCRGESAPHDVTYIETNTMRQQSRDFLAAFIFIPLILPCFVSSDRQTDRWEQSTKEVPFSSSTAMHLINEATLLAVALEFMRQNQHPSRTIYPQLINRRSPQIIIHSQSHTQLNRR